MNFAKALGFRQDTFSAVTVSDFQWLTLFTLFIVLDDKGGVGKSFLAQVLAAIVRYFNGYTVRMIDTDFSNSSTAQIDGSTKMLNLEERLQTGILINLIRELASGTVSHAVMDVGAREEDKVRKLLPWLKTLVDKAGGRLVVVRPITLGSHNQRNAAAFMDPATELGIPVVFVCNEGQGRQPAYFDRWKSTETCRAALEKGAVQTFLTDADVRYVDEAVGLGLSMMDVASADFSKLAFNEVPDPAADPDARQEFDERHAEAKIDLALAQEFFTDDVIAFVNEWLRFNIQNIGSAIQEAIDKRAEIDAAAVSADQPASDPKLQRKKKR